MLNRINEVTGQKAIIIATGRKNIHAEVDGRLIVLDNETFNILFPSADLAGLEDYGIFEPTENRDGVRYIFTLPIKPNEPVDTQAFMKKSKEDALEMMKDIQEKHACAKFTLDKNYYMRVDGINSVNFATYLYVS